MPRKCNTFSCRPLPNASDTVRACAPTQTWDARARTHTNMGHLQHLTPDPWSEQICTRHAPSPRATERSRPGRRHQARRHPLPSAAKGHAFVRQGSAPGVHRVRGPDPTPLPQLGSAGPSQVWGGAKCNKKCEVLSVMGHQVNRFPGAPCGVVKRVSLPCGRGLPCTMAAHPDFPVRNHLRPPSPKPQARHQLHVWTASDTAGGFQYRLHASMA